AKDPATAIAELRPWGSAYVTVATFRLEASIQVVDLTPVMDLCPELDWGTSRPCPRSSAADAKREDKGG
ncbi:MAG: hypothetical protein O7E52_25010, partial [Candidatus Poribacteria bacterium]|nr:hypothetical protein [Candidatus Poribacteria bacterium]